MTINEKTLTKAEMEKREEIAQAISRDDPSMPMSKKMAIATSKAKEVAEGKAHTIPKTPKDKSLAALAAPRDKITHADVMVGRGVGRKKTLKEFVEQLAESFNAIEVEDEEVERIDEMEKDVSGPGRDGTRDGAYFAGSKDKKPIIKMTDKQRKESERMAAALSSAAMRHPKLKEDAEQIDEISKDLVDKYRTRAWNWVSKATNAPARYYDGRKTVAAQQAYLHKAAQKITKAAKRLKSMELADTKFSARPNATHVVPATSKYKKYKKAK